MPANTPIEQIKSAPTQSNDKETQILIAEDNQISSLLIKKTLNHIGFYNIHQVNSGMEAVSYLRQRKEHRLTIYITDIAMPGEMDGIEAARIIGREYSLPVIFVTGFSDKETINRAKDIQPAAYLLKPFKSEDVMIAVEMAIYKARIQQELSQTERHNHLLAAALESTQDAVMIVDTVNDIPRIEFVNQAFYQLFDQCGTNCIHASIEDIVGNNTAHDWVTRIHNVIKHDFSEEWECRINTDHKKLLRISASPIKDSKHRNENVVLVIRDITSIRLAEERQQHSQKIEAIGRFTGGIAHDFNNLLAVINSYSDLIKLKMGDQNPYIQYIDNIRSAGQRGTDLVAQLMTFTRSKPTSPRIMNLCETTESTFVMLRRLIRVNIELQVHYTDDPLLIKASPSQIEQILVNLCVNARDAIESEGQIKITLSRTKNKEANKKSENLACLTVADNGAGMPEAILDKIFEPFFTTKDVGKGTGLGLSTVYGIVRQNKGSIDVQSKKGKGTTFRIYFPEKKPEKLSH